MTEYNFNSYSYSKIFKSIREDQKIAFKCVPFILNESRDVTIRTLVCEACISASKGLIRNYVLRRVILESSNANILWEALVGYIAFHEDVTPKTIELVTPRLKALTLVEDKDVRHKAKQALSIHDRNM